ncbi:MAG: BON domain-containing protein [Acidobacteriota bacterium]|nr:BON domain-containing protein [Acidobacteriota bacterium]
MTIPRFIPALAFLAALAGLSQASPAANPVSPNKNNASPGVHGRNAPARQNAISAISDADLEKAIRARFARSKISTNKFTCHVQGGVATLEGHTGVIQHKGTATRLAKSAGAIAVVNKIEISEEAREKAANNLAKGRRRAQVTRSDVVARSSPR